MKRILGLDVGTRRLGVAISDAMGWTAQPLETITIDKQGSHWVRLVSLCDTHAVDTIVAGLPLELSGKVGPAARRTRRFLTRVAAHTGASIVEIDERMTSLQAERVLQSVDSRQRASRGADRDKGAVDRVAASLILQVYLDRGDTP